MDARHFWRGRIRSPFSAVRQGVCMSGPAGGASVRPARARRRPGARGRVDLLVAGACEHFVSDAMRRPDLWEEFGPDVKKLCGDLFGRRSILPGRRAGP